MWILEVKISYVPDRLILKIFLEFWIFLCINNFHRQLVALLRENSVKYGFFNILADDDVRQGLKEFSDWPTFPQFYVDGELVGGLDIVSFENLETKSCIQLTKECLGQGRNGKRSGLSQGIYGTQDLLGGC